MKEDDGEEGESDLHQFIGNLAPLSHIDPAFLAAHRLGVRVTSGKIRTCTALPSSYPTDGQPYMI
jgi:hypothetical protein